MSSSEFDCTRCGACCFGKHDRYVVLLPEDQNRALPEAALHEIDGRRYLKMFEGHCAQLCASGDGQLLCSVYEQRPEACRAFRAGSFECKAALRHNLVLADAIRHPCAEAKGPEAELPPAHVIALLPKGRSRPPA